MSTLEIERIEPRTAPIGAIPAWRVWWWSVRRELWESRSVLVVPVVTAGLVLAAFLVYALRAADIGRTLGDVSTAVVLIPAPIAAGVVVAISAIGGFFYCLDALHRERIDRSILFWKSLPVSDRMAVLSKASVPMLVLPIATFVLVVALLVAMRAVAAVTAGDGGVSSPWPLADTVVVLAYALAAGTCWYAPVTAWLFLVSALARRAAFVFAVLPVLLLGFVERLAFGSDVVWSTVRHRLAGFAAEGFVPGHPLPIPAPMQLVTGTGLWIGLVVAGALFGATVWLRRRQGPL